ncbi:NUDIX hydrolase [Flindersiella endophytica]
MGGFRTEYSLPVEQADGCALLAFEQLDDAGLALLAHRDPAVPLAASLVVLWCDGRCLMVFNRFRDAWELPGGMVDPGESAREAAFRELEEESGQRPGALDLAGVALSRVAPDDRLEHLAIYHGRIESPLPFTPNEEMSRSIWWDPAEPLPGLAPIDGALAWLCRPAEGSPAG